MVEGHQCHRVAAAHRKLLLHKKFEATSPNGRFAAGAAAIHNRPLRRIEVHGKNLFYFFADSEALATYQLAPAPATPSASTSGGPQAAALTPITAATAAAAAPAAAGGDVPASVSAPDAGPATPQPRGRRRRVQTQDVTPAESQSAEPVSPQGEAGTSSVADGATAAAEVQLGQQEQVVVVRIHFGMSGAFRINTLPGPEPTATTRLALQNSELGLVAHLSAMTVEHGGLDLYRNNIKKLGPDPLREDADKEVLWRSMRKSRKPVGLVLMSQELIAGLGNIYRAEVLFKAGVHPEQPSTSITRAQFDQLWFHSVQLLQRGFVSGSILTVDPEEAVRLGKPWTRRYIYNQERCGRCKGTVRSWDMAGRTVYCCETCQPLITGASGPAQPPPAAQAATPSGRARSRTGASDVQSTDGVIPPATPGAGKAVGAVDEAGLARVPAAAAAVMLSPARAKALKQARPAQVFRSKCAPDEEDAGGVPVPGKMTVAQLKAQLLSLCMSTQGRKADLVTRLTTALQATSIAAATPIMAGDSGSEDELDQAEALLAANLGVGASAAQGAGSLAGARPGPSLATSVPMDVTPGTQGLVDQMASAKEAAMEKRLAGESRAVEHVALAGDDVEDLVQASGSRPPRKRKATADPQL